MDKGHGKLTVTCTNWRPYHKNILCGFALVRIAELGVKIHEVAIHRKADRTWAALPARPRLKGTEAITDDNGKILYAITLEFDRREIADAFSRAVIDAVVRFDPHAFAIEEAVT